MRLDETYMVSMKLQNKKVVLTLTTTKKQIVVVGCEDYNYSLIHKTYWDKIPVGYGQELSKCGLFRIHKDIFLAKGKDTKRTVFVSRIPLVSTKGILSTATREEILIDPMY